LVLFARYDKDDGIDKGETVGACNTDRKMRTEYEVIVLMIKITDVFGDVGVHTVTCPGNETSN
jgi:hypothetical protein